MTAPRLIDALLRTAAAAALLAPLAAAAQSTTTASADLSLDVGYSTRPSSSSLGAATAYASAAIAPRVKIRSSRTTIDLDGEAQLYQYARVNQRDDNYKARASIASQFSPEASGTLRGHYEDRSLNRFGELLGDLDPGGADDATLLGTGTRRRSFGGDVAAATRLDGRSSLSVDGRWTRSRYSGRSFGALRLSSMDVVATSVGYTVATSERVTVGVRGNFTHTDYVLPLFPDSNAYGGAATLKLRLDSRLTFDAALGATMRELANAVAKDQVFLTGSASLCYAGDRSNFCAHGARSVGNSGIAGTSIQTNIGANFSRRLTERGTITADVAYNRATGSTTALAARSYFTGAIGYDMRMSERLRLTSSVFYRGSRGALALGDDYGGRVGVSYRVGDTQ